MRENKTLKRAKYICPVMTESDAKKLENHDLK